MKTNEETNSSGTGKAENEGWKMKLSSGIQR
jgi:hypothetical protein